MDALTEHATYIIISGYHRIYLHWMSQRKFERQKKRKKRTPQALDWQTHTQRALISVRIRNMHWMPDRSRFVDQHHVGTRTPGGKGFTCRDIIETQTRELCCDIVFQTQPAWIRVRERESECVCVNERRGAEQENENTTQRNRVRVEAEIEVPDNFENSQTHVQTQHKRQSKQTHTYTKTEQGET